MIDDGSTDATRSICEEYTSLSNFHYYYQSNGGPAKARNFGLMKSSGEWVTFVDSDDYVDSGYFERVSLEMAHADIIVCGHFNNFEKSIQQECSPSKYMIVEGEGYSTFLNCLQCGGTKDYVWDKFYKKKIIDDNGLHFKNIKTAEDTLFNVGYFLYVRKAVVLPCSFYHYYISDNSLSRGFQSDKLIAHNLLESAYKELFAKDANNTSQEFMRNFCIQSRIFGVISNYYYTKNSPKSSISRKVVKGAVLDNVYLLELLNKYPEICKTINQMIIRFFIIHRMYSLFNIYNIIVGILKKM